MHSSDLYADVGIYLVSRIAGRTLSGTLRTACRRVGHKRRLASTDLQFGGLHLNLPEATVPTYSKILTIALQVWRYNLSPVSAFIWFLNLDPKHMYSC